LIMALLIMPWMLRIFLGLRPLPAGPLRDRLEATIRRLKFRFSALLLWNTRNSSANALVTGILPWPRYIVLTDQLLRDLTVEEVEAVIGHEIGHVKHHHMTFYMMFLFASLVSLGLIWESCEIFLQSAYARNFANDWLPALAPWLETKNFELIAAFPPLLAVAAYLFIVFGYLSRCCETQADIFGSRTVSSEAFISALEKVAILNGIPREKPGWLSCWRHPTIAKRVDFLRRMGEDPTLEPRFQRRVGVLKWSLALGLAAVLATLLLFVPDERKPQPTIDKQEESQQTGEPGA
jgi:STE24 endopeptidase